MATFSVNVDTESKKMTVSLNGQLVNNVVGVRIYDSCNYDGEKSYSISVMTSSEENHVKTYTEHMLMCEIEEDMAMATANVLNNIPGFIKKPSLTETQNHIRELLKR